MGRSKKSERAARGLQVGPLPAALRGARAIAPTVRARVKYIVARMIAQRWAGELAHQELAEEWGVAELTVRDYATEASRHFESLFSETEKLALKGLYVEAFRRYARKAEKLERIDWAIEATEKAAEYQGAAPQKITRSEVTGAAGGPLALRLIPLEDLDELRKAAEANECPSAETKSETKSEPSF